MTSNTTTTSSVYRLARYWRTDPFPADLASSASSSSSNTNNNPNNNTTTKWNTLRDTQNIHLHLQTTSNNYSTNPMNIVLKIVYKKNEGSEIILESWSLKDIPTEMIRAFLGPKQTFAFVYFHNMEKTEFRKIQFRLASEPDSQIVLEKLSMFLTFKEPTGNNNVKGADNNNGNGSVPTTPTISRKAMQTPNRGVGGGTAESPNTPVMNATSMTSNTEEDTIMRNHSPVFDNLSQSLVFQHSQATQPQQQPQQRSLFQQSPSSSSNTPSFSQPSQHQPNLLSISSQQQILPPSLPMMPILPAFMSQHPPIPMMTDSQRSNSSSASLSSSSLSSTIPGMMSQYQQNQQIAPCLPSPAPTSTSSSTRVPSTTNNNNSNTAPDLMNPTSSLYTLSDETLLSYIDTCLCDEQFRAFVERMESIYEIRQIL